MVEITRKKALGDPSLFYRIGDHGDFFIFSCRGVVGKESSSLLIGSVKRTSQGPWQRHSGLIAACAVYKIAKQRRRQNKGI